MIPLLKTQFFENGAVFSPDGKWLAFLSDESGQAEIYVQAIDRGDDSLRVTGERFLISRQGAQCLRWRKDARELYYLGLDGQLCPRLTHHVDATVWTAESFQLIVIPGDAHRFKGSCKTPLCPP